MNSRVLALSQFELPVSSDLYRPICYQFRMRHAHGLFISQPIRTLENINYIFLAQSALKKLRILFRKRYLTVAYLLMNNVSTCGRAGCYHTRPQVADSGTAS